MSHSYKMTQFLLFASLPLGIGSFLRPTFLGFYHLQSRGRPPSNAHLEGANLSNANLIGVKLQRAYLEGSNLQRAILKNTDLREGILAGANLQDAHLEDAD